MAQIAISFGTHSGQCVFRAAGTGTTIFVAQLSGRGIVVERIGGTRKPVLRQASATLHLRSPHERCA